MFDRILITPLSKISLKSCEVLRGNSETLRVNTWMDLEIQSWSVKCMIAARIRKKFEQLFILS